MSMAERTFVNRHVFLQAYMWSLVAVGLTVILFAAFKLTLEPLDMPFVLLSLMVVASSMIAVRIPRVSGRITVADTFIFLTLLLYGAPAAVLMSGLEGLCTTLLISKRPRTILFNSAILATSTFVTATVLTWAVGPPAEVIKNGFSANFFLTICVMALLQYASNTGLIAIEKSSKTGESIWHTWKTYYLWTSVTYFAGASAAAIIASLIITYGFYAIVATVPIILIIYFTYQTYVKNIEASAAQTEAARRHVEELSKYIAELKVSEEERGNLLVRAERARAERSLMN
jgi:hypothetical protein